MGDNKRDCTTPELVMKYLSVQNKMPRELFHFTSYQALLSILRNRSFRFSRMDRLNDKAEMKLGLEHEHKRSYVMSFTEETERVSMWTMYGKSIGIKLRLGFSRESFAEQFKENNVFFRDNEGYEQSIERHFKPLIPIKKYESQTQLSKVAYYDKKQKIIYDSGPSYPFPIEVNDKAINELTGFVKYSAWEAEHEIRARALLDYNIADLEKKEIDYLYMKLSDKLIRSFRITYNPWVSEELKREIANSLNGLAGTELVYENSSLTGQVDESILHS